MAFPYARVAFAHTETMKTDGLGRGLASWGRLHPFLLSSLPPPRLFLSSSLSFLSGLDLPFICPSLSFFWNFIPLAHFLSKGRQRQGEKSQVSHLLKHIHHLSPPLSSPDSRPPTLSGLPYDIFCCYCLGIRFGQMYKCSQETIKNVFSGVGGMDFFPRELPFPPLSSP